MVREKPDRHGSQKKKTGCLKFFLLGFIVVASLGTLIFWSYRPLPSTSDLQSYFAAHREDFNRINQRIINIVSENKKLSLDEESKFAEILGIKFIEVLSADPPGVKYYSHKRGIGVASYGTGIAYLYTPPAKVYSAFETMKEDAKDEGFIGFCKLEDNWYSFLWAAD